MENKVRYNWATLGTGVITMNWHKLWRNWEGKLYSVANRTYQKA